MLTVCRSVHYYPRKGRDAPAMKEGPCAAVVADVKEVAGKTLANVSVCDTTGHWHARCEIPFFADPPTDFDGAYCVFPPRV